MHHAAQQLLKTSQRHSCAIHQTHPTTLKVSWYYCCVIHTTHSTTLQVSWYYCCAIHQTYSTTLQVSWYYCCAIHQTYSTTLQVSWYYCWVVDQTHSAANLVMPMLCNAVMNSLFVGCFTSQQQASVSQGRICSDNFTCCHAEIEVADQTFYLTQSQYTDAEQTSPIANPITPGAWQGSHWSANFLVTGMTRSGKIPSQAGFKPRIFRSQGGRLNH